MLEKLFFILKGNEFYPDLIASTLSMYGANKSIEILFFAIAALLAYAVGMTVGRKTATLHAPEITSLSVVIFDRILAAIFVVLSGTALLAVLHAYTSVSAQALSSIRFFIYLAAVGSLASNPSARFFHVAQVALPLLLFRYFRIEYANGSASTSSTLNTLGSVLALVLVAALIFGAFQELKTQSTPGKPQVLRSTVISVAVFFAFHLPKLAPLHLDDYHTGEMFVPFTQIARFGLKRFVDFVSVHGELAFSYGAIHHYLLDGTAASIGHAMVLLTGICALVSSSLLAFLVGGRLALGIAVFITPVIDRFYCVPILFLVFFAIERFRESPRIRVCLFAILDAVLLPFALLFNPASGMALIFASLPAQLDFACEKIARRDWRAILSVVLAVAFTLLVLRSPLLGVAHFIRDNGIGTLQAFGLPTSLPPSPPSWMKNVQNESIRSLAAQAFKMFKLYAWILGLLLVAVSLGRSRRMTHPLLLAMTIFPMTLIPYTLGRVGQEGLDRVGAMGVLVIGLFLPLIAAMRFRESRRLSAITVLVFAVGFGIRAFGEIKDFHEPVALSSQRVSVSHGDILVNGQELDIPKLGETFITQDRMNELLAFKKLRDRLGDRFENFRYVDVTNRQIYFFLLDAPVSQLYPSHLLAINSAIQNAMNGAIDRFKPLIAWIGPSHDHEAVTFPLRAYRLYRHLLIGLGFRKIETLGPLTFLSPVTTTHDIVSTSAHDIDVLRALWFRPDLGNTAIEWGKNERTLDRRLRKLDLAIKKTLTRDKRSTFFFESPVSGQDVDLIKIHVDRSESSGSGTFSIEFDDMKSFSFSHSGMKRETLLIPIGADPYWLLKKHSSISVNGTPASEVLKIEAFRIEN